MSDHTIAHRICKNNQYYLLCFKYKYSDRLFCRCFDFNYIRACTEHCLDRVSIAFLNLSSKTGKFKRKIIIKINVVA